VAGSGRPHGKVATIAAAQATFGGGHQLTSFTVRKYSAMPLPLLPSKLLQPTNPPPKCHPVANKSQPLFDPAIRQPNRSVHGRRHLTNKKVDCSLSSVVIYSASSGHALTIFISCCGLISRSHTKSPSCHVPLVIVVPHEYEPLLLSSFSCRPFPLSRP
jgi:hypothetical protein